jgi:hypothetical protein
MGTGTSNFRIDSHTCTKHRVPTPTSPSSTRGKAGGNHLNEEITPLLPSVTGERFSQTISNLGHAVLLRYRTTAPVLPPPPPSFTVSQPIHRQSYILLTNGGRGAQWAKCGNGPGSVLDPHGFQCRSGSGSSILGQCGSRSRGLITKKGKSSQLKNI